MDPARDFCSGPACSAHSARAVESVPGAAAAVTRVRIRSILFVLVSWEGPGMSTRVGGVTGMMVTVRVADSGLCGTVPKAKPLLARRRRGEFCG